MHGALYGRALLPGAVVRQCVTMHAGPVTILNWSFPRKDISRSAQAYQLALALRAEVADLEAAGCKVIQVRARTRVQGFQHMAPPPARSAVPWGPA